ncbi:hypothetical protein Hanom_Chr01g00049551 [Helianthus anomalus]
MRCGVVPHLRRTSRSVAHRPRPPLRRWRPSADVSDEPIDWVMVGPLSSSLSP